MDFVVFAPNPWHDIWRNRQQIFSRLAARHRVLYIEPVRASLADWRRGRIALHDLRRPAVIRERPNLWLYRAPAILPSRDTGGRFDHVSDRLLATHLRRTLSGLGFLSSDINRSPLTINQLPILWLYRPTNWRWAANTIPHRLLVYHITDDYTAFGHLSADERDTLAAAERDLLAAADLTIVTAPRLLELKRTYARRIELVPNGVDFEAFQRAAANPRKLPQLQHLADQFPLIGYSGHISSRLDLPLLRQIALARPTWQFVFAGSEDPRGCEEELTALKAQPNVHFLGVLPVEDVPHSIAACDVCLIPYHVTDETLSISSLKLFEYLAAGKPVVSARVPAAEEHSAVVRIAEGKADSWIHGLETALAARSIPPQVAARQTVASGNSWTKRVGQIEEALVNAQSSVF